MKQHSFFNVFTRKIEIVRACLAAAALFLGIAPSGAALIPGSLVVERVGSGSGTLNAASTPVFLDLFNPDGTSAGSSLSLPNAASRPASNPFNLTDSGSAGSDGLVTRSANGLLIEIPGYNGISSDAAIASSSAAVVSRTIGVLNAAGAVDTSRSLSMLSGNNFRTVVSADGSAFWAAGAAGIVYVNGATATSLCTSNTRAMNIFNNQLYYSTQSGTAGIYSLGSGLPVSAPATATLVIATAGNPDAFQFNVATNVVYIADDRASKGGVFKYTYSAGAWVSNYLFSITGGAFGLAVDWSGASPVIFATTADGSKLVRITDTNSAATVVTLATAATYTALRGVAFAPAVATVDCEVQGINVDSGNHTATVCFAGVPNDSYTVQRSTNLTSWTDVWTTNAPAGGLFRFVDDGGVDPMGRAYYRLRYNP